jgi:hypothetical protein
MDKYNYDKKVLKLTTFATKRERRKLVFEWIKTGVLSFTEFTKILNENPNFL